MIRDDSDINILNVHSSQIFNIVLSFFLSLVAELGFLIISSVVMVTRTAALRDFINKVRRRRMSNRYNPVAVKNVLLFSWE